MDDLTVWESQLPIEMQYQGIGGGTGVRFWSTMLHIAYKYSFFPKSEISYSSQFSNYIILLYRPGYANSKSAQGSSKEDMLLIAANKITRTVDDLLSERRARCAPLHVYVRFIPLTLLDCTVQNWNLQFWTQFFKDKTDKLNFLLYSVAGVFAALSIHIMSIRRSSDEVSKKLADHRAQMCMLGLTEMQEPWPCGGWILRVFVRMMEKVKNQGTANAVRAISQKRDNSVANIQNSNMESSIEFQNQTGQEVLMPVDTAHGGDSEMGSSGMGLEGQIDSGQFSIDDGSFMLNMVNEADYFFPGDLGQDFSSQIPYFRDFSMLGN